MKRVVVIAIVVAIVLAVLELAASHGGPRLAFPVTDSLPRGLYLFVPVEPQRGEVARVCLPSALADFALARGIERKGGDCADGTVPLGKVVAGVGGDVIDVDASGVWVNGALWPQSQQLERDSQGRPVDLRQPYGSHRLGTGEVWLMGRSQDSWDSRYIGAFSRLSLGGRFIPLFTQEKKK